MLKIVDRFVDGAIVPVTDEMAARIIEVDNDNADDISTMRKWRPSVSCFRNGCGEIFFAIDARQKGGIWKLRRRVAEAVKIDGYTIEEEIPWFPGLHLPELIRGVKSWVRI
ncbi:MAG: hypothetical protein U0T56_11405 [Ferruginibacter sp.]